MTRYTYLLIIWAIAFSCAVGRGDTMAPKPEDRYGDSKWQPVCLEKRCKEPKRNVIYLFAGPPAVHTLQPNKGLLGVGYFRQLKDDLELGVIGIGTDRSFIGGALGIGARF